MESNVFLRFEKKFSNKKKETFNYLIKISNTISQHGHDENLACCKISRHGTKTLFVVFRTAGLICDNSFYDVTALCVSDSGTC